MPWDIDAEQATQIACECEAAALDYDSRVTNSEGASVQAGQSIFVYGNTHGFIDGYPGTQHSLSCAVLAKQGTEMQRDYWYSAARVPSALESAVAIGELAAQRLSLIHI